MANLAVRDKNFEHQYMPLVLFHHTFSEKSNKKVIRGGENEALGIGI